MLEAEISDLGTPAEEEGGEGEHGRDVAHSDVADVDTPDNQTLVLTRRTSGHLSRVSSSRCVRSQAMYSRAASVILGHQERSRLTNFRRFSAINSIPSSVTLLQPERERMVRFGSE